VKLSRPQVLGSFLLALIVLAFLLVRASPILFRK
jgi:hypothetical protein